MTAATRRPWTGALLPLCLLLGLGVALRAIALWLARDIGLLADEGRYVYLALHWNRFGFYTDSFRYLWPPGYSFVLAGALGFGPVGVLLVKGLQVLASASVGLSTMWLAGHLFGRRAALVAAGVWCVYLPLIAFTHSLWNETLFLACFSPALCLLLSAGDAPPGGRDWRLVGAGLAFAAALYIKEAPLYLALLLAGVAVADTRGANRTEALRGALLFLVVLTTAVLPWTLRNVEVYGRLVPLGASLGENAYGGLNEEYKNFDLAPIQREFFWEEAPEGRTRRVFVDAPDGSGWARAQEIMNTPDRLAENVRRGRAYAVEHPGWLARSRLKKLADAAIPLSFFVRNTGLGVYDGTVLGGKVARRGLTGFALLCSTAVMWLSVPGAVALWRRWPSGSGLIFAVLGYFGITCLIVAMSRFRVPALPLMIALAAGALAGLPAIVREWRRREWFALVAGWGWLAFLWWVDWPETTSVIGIAWAGAP